MTKYYNKLKKIWGSIFDRLLLKKRKIRLQLGLENRSEGFILNLQNIHYFLSNLYNFISFKFLNGSKIF